MGKSRAAGPACQDGLGEGIPVQPCSVGTAGHVSSHLARATPLVLAAWILAFFPLPFALLSAALTITLLRLCPSPLPTPVSSAYTYCTFNYRRCNYVRPGKTQDQDENGPREEDSRPHTPLTIATPSPVTARQSLAQSQCIRSAIQSIPVDCPLANNLSGTYIQVGIRVACRHSQTQGHRYAAVGKQR